MQERYCLTVVNGTDSIKPILQLYVDRTLFMLNQNSLEFVQLPTSCF